MYLNKLLIKDFGKFNNEEITLEQGINLIQGDKNSGKSTIKDFIVAMLYGFSNCSLNERKNDKFEMYKPSNGGVYSGKAYLKDEENTYFVERSFAKKNSRTSVLDIKSGRDVKLENDNLDGKLFECCRDNYVNGMCIDDRNGDYDGYLKHDFDNMIVTGTALVDVDKSIAYLRKKKKEFDTSALSENIDIIDSELEDFDDVDKRLRDVRKKLRDVEEELAIETARRKREARRLIQTKPVSDEEEDSTENKDVKNNAAEAVEDEKSGEKTDRAVFLDADLLKDYKPEKKLTDRIWFIILTGLFVIGVIAAVVYILPFDNAVRQIFVICTILFVIVTIVEGLYAKGEFGEEVKTPSEDEFKRIIYELERKTETYEEVEIDMSFADTYIEKREKLTDEERAILNDMARRDELKEERRVHEEKLASAKQELHAINLAINTIMEISRDISKSYSFMINNNISDIISGISGNRFNDIYINEKNKLMIMGQNGYVDISALNDEEIRQVYISVRLAIARSMTDNNMPLIIDDVLDDLKDDILENVLKIIKSFKNDQIILMSADHKVADMIKNLYSGYNLICIK